MKIKLAITKEDQETEEIRDAGLLFENIADATGLSGEAVKEIDETNYLAEIKKLQKKFKY